MTWRMGWLWLLATLSLSLSMQAQAQTTVEYIHTDALGSVVAVTNAAGQVIERNDYEPYGAIIGQPNFGGVGFTGHVQDATTGLTYMQQRYYDPMVGRFLSVDPITADGNAGGNFNRYKYAANNPYRFIDPDGRQEASCTGSRVSCPSATQGAPQNEPGMRSSGRARSSARSRNDNVPRAAGPGSVFESENTAQSEADAYIVDMNGGPVLNWLSGQNYFVSIEQVGGGAYTYTLIPQQGGIAPGVGLRGGGALSTVFKTAHYAARLEGAGLSVVRTQAIVAREVARIRPNLATGADVLGRMRVNGVLIEYRMHLLPNGTVNVGSIFPVR